MVADMNVHWDMGRDGSPKPHAHVMLSMREVGPEGFGQKVREWNSTALLQEWREAWADHVNERLAELDIDARIDQDRKSVVSGKSVSVRVDLGGRRIIKKKKQ